MYRFICQLGIKIRHVVNLVNWYNGNKTTHCLRSTGFECSVYAFSKRRFKLIPNIWLEC